MKKIPITKILGILFGIIVCLLIVQYGVAHAQWTEWREYIPAEIRARTLQDYVRSILDAALIIAGVVAVVYLIVGGYQYITSSGNAEAATLAKGTITNALVGLIIIFASYVIIDFVMNAIRGRVNTPTTPIPTTTNPSTTPTTSPEHPEIDEGDIIPT